MNKLTLNKEKFLTEQQVEDIYGLNKRTLQRERTYNTGIPFYKFGRRVLYRVSVIEEHIDKCQKGNWARYD